MSVYDPLYRWLSKQKQNSVSLSFNEIEKILDRELPASARKYPLWWGNEDIDDTTHVQCKAWLAAGFRASYPDLNNERIVFEKEPVTLR